MTTLNAASLIAVSTTDQKLAAMLAELDSLGFSATTWQSGAVHRTLIEMFAATHAAETALLAQIFKGGYLDDAEGDWLTLLAAQFFRVTRTEATSTVYTVTLYETAGSPQSIVAGAVWVGTSSGLRYVNTTGGTLLAGGSLDIQVRAEGPGAAYNVGTGAINIMHTPIAGVTCSNITGVPITSGSDAEKDAPLRQRCRDKWSSLGAGGNATAYRYWSMEASDQVKKVLVTANPGAVAGKVGVTIAGQTSGLSAGVVSTVQAALVSKCPVCATPATASATTETVPIVADVYVSADDAADYEAAANALLDEIFVDVAIGGTIYESELITALQIPAGSAGYVDMTSPTADVSPTVATALLVKGTPTITVHTL
jgi:uncharacterized phage protein gp47/JayE